MRRATNVDGGATDRLGVAVALNGRLAHHIRSEDENLDTEVRIDMVGAHEADYGAAGQRSISASMSSCIASGKPWRTRITVSSSPILINSRLGHGQRVLNDYEYRTAANRRARPTGPRPLTAAVRRTTAGEIAAANGPPLKHSSDIRFRPSIVLLP